MVQVLGSSSSEAMRVLIQIVALQEAMNRANWQREEPEVQRKAAAFNRWHEPDDARVSSLVL